MGTTCSSPAVMQSTPSFSDRSWCVLLEEFCRCDTNPDPTRFLMKNTTHYSRDVRERTKTKASEIETSECVEVGKAVVGMVEGLCDEHSDWSCCCLEHTEEETTTALTEAWMTRILGGCPGQGERKR